MTGFLRFMGIVNAAVWFGAAIFFTFGVGPGIFSEEVRKLLGESAFQYYAGGVAQVLIKRYFTLQIICSLIALLHLFAEWLYLGKKPGRFLSGMLLAFFVFGLFGGFALVPRMQALRQAKYFGATPEQKEQAARSFGAWHGFSQAANVFIMLGLLIYLTRVSRPPEAGRYSTSLAKFHS